MFSIVVRLGSAAPVEIVVAVEYKWVLGPENHGLRLMEIKSEKGFMRLGSY